MRRRPLQAIEEEVVATYEPEPAPFVEMPAPEPVRAAEPLPSLDDPTTALERAIAALKAGDLAAFAREAQSDYSAPEPVYTLRLYTRRLNRWPRRRRPKRLLSRSRRASNPSRR